MGEVCGAMKDVFGKYAPTFYGRATAYPAGQCAMPRDPLLRRRPGRAHRRDRDRVRRHVRLPADRRRPAPAVTRARCTAVHRASGRRRPEAHRPGRRRRPARRRRTWPSDRDLWSEVWVTVPRRRSSIGPAGARRATVLRAAPRRRPPSSPSATSPRPAQGEVRSPAPEYDARCQQRVAPGRRPASNLPRAGRRSS